MHVVRKTGAIKWSWFVVPVSGAWVGKFILIFIHNATNVTQSAHYLLRSTLETKQKRFGWKENRRNLAFWTEKRNTQFWTENGNRKIAKKSSNSFTYIHWLYHKLTYLNCRSMFDDRGTSKRPSLCWTLVSSSSEMWYWHSPTISICLQHNKILVETLKALSFLWINMNDTSLP